MSISHRAYVSLGSNSPDAAAMLARAGAILAQLGAVLACSQIYETEPQGFADQPWFLNQVMVLLLQENWTPSLLVRHLLEIEKSFGRKRGQIRFGPRCIDLDLLLFDNLSQAQPECVVPHPRLHERAFVLVPLMEIEPNMVIAGRTLQELLQSLKWRREGNKIFQESPGKSE